MSWWLLLLLVFVVWLLLTVATLAEKAVDDARRGIPEEHRHGVSIAPIIPICPLIFWGLAMLIDVVADPWGSRIIGWFHTALGVLSLVSIIWSIWCLRSIEKSTDMDD